MKQMKIIFLIYSKPPRIMDYLCKRCKCKATQGALAHSVFMLFSENDQSLIPLYHKVLPKLNGKFREAQQFRPLRIIIQIFTIQLAFWLTILSFQSLLITLPSIILKITTTKLEDNNTKSIIYPNLDLLFNLQNYSIKTIETSLNCLSFLISGFIR